MQHYGKGKATSAYPRPLSSSSYNKGKNMVVQHCMAANYSFLGERVFSLDIRKTATALLKTATRNYSWRKNARNRGPSTLGTTLALKIRSSVSQRTMEGRKGKEDNLGGSSIDGRCTDREERLGKTVVAYGKRWTKRFDFSKSNIERWGEGEQLL